MNIAPNQLLILRGAPPDSRIVAVVRNPGETAAEWAERARLYVLERTLELPAEWKVSTWESGGITIEVATEQGATETEARWHARHKEAVEAMQQEFPPND